MTALAEPSPWDDHLPPLPGDVWEFDGELLLPLDDDEYGWEDPGFDEPEGDGVDAAVQPEWVVPGATHARSGPDDGLSSGCVAALAETAAAVTELRLAQARCYRALTALRASDAVGETGYRSMTRLLGDHVRLDETEARRMDQHAASLAETVSPTGTPIPADLPATAAQVSAGVIGSRHVEVIRTTMGRLSAVPGLDPDTLAVTEEQLAELATTLTPKALSEAATAILALLDPDGTAPVDDPLPENELHYQRRRDGSLAGKFTYRDPAAAETLHTALSAATPPPDTVAERVAGSPRGESAEAHALRTLPERRAHALLELAGEALTGGLNTTDPPAGIDDEDTASCGAFPADDDLDAPTGDDVSDDHTNGADGPGAGTEARAADVGHANGVNGAPEAGAEPRADGDGVGDATEADANAAEGDAVEGDAAEDDAVEGDAAEDDAAEGDAAEGDAAEGDAAEGDTAGQADDGAEDEKTRSAPRAGGAFGTPTDPDLGERAPDPPGGPPAWTRADLEGGDRVALTLTLSFDALRSALSAPADPGEPGHAAVGHTGLLGLLGENTWVRPETARRLACDADLVPAVLGSTSEVLDLGRKMRIVNRALRRAVILRDRHCAHPGCRRRARRCQVHHVEHWIDGGESSLENCVLLCAYHHTLIHHSGWEIHMLDGLPWFIPPAFVDPARRPRHNRPWVIAHRAAA